jgi:ribose-phosphate pyrophosphokinase
MSKFVIKTNGYNYYPEVFTFSGGEVSVKLPKHLRTISGDNQYTLKAQLHSSEDVMTLLLIKDALDTRFGNPRSILSIPYVPYARQDRVCNYGEAFSIKVMSSLINSMNFDKVYTCDNHSDVSTALINNCINIPPETIMERSRDLTHILTKTKVALCSPDAGANKKILKVAQHFGGVPVIKADKIRDTTTGEITHTEVYCDDLNGQVVMIVDDICDGGKTFIELAKKLKEKNAGPIILYVTHGIFSKGVHVLYNNDIHAVYTTDSFTPIEKKTPALNIIKL